MKLVDDPLRGNTDGTNKELGLLLDNNVDEIRELSLGVVILQERELGTRERGEARTLVLRALPPTCGSRRSTP